jgi:hypothetical protein
MKLVFSDSSIGLDRLATWNEVRCAMSFSAQRALELVGERRACHVTEETMWLAIVKEISASIAN